MCQVVRNGAWWLARCSAMSLGCQLWEEIMSLWWPKLTKGPFWKAKKYGVAWSCVTLGNTKNDSVTSVFSGKINKTKIHGLSKDIHAMIYELTNFCWCALQLKETWRGWSLWPSCHMCDFGSNLLKRESMKRACASFPLQQCAKPFVHFNVFVHLIGVRPKKINQSCVKSIKKKKHRHIASVTFTRGNVIFLPWSFRTTFLSLEPASPACLP